MSIAPLIDIIAAKQFNTFLVNNDSFFRQLALGRDAIEAIDLPLRLKFMVISAIDERGTASFPVFLPINPDDWQTDYKKRAEIDYTAGGFIVNEWHDDITSIQASGYLPSFKSRAKFLTSSYLNFSKLLKLYTMIGRISTTYGSNDGFPISVDDSASKGVAGKDGVSESVTIQMSISRQKWVRARIIYQNEQFDGIFMTFTTTEKYEEPNTLRYSFTFKALSKTNLFGELNDAGDIQNS